VAADAGEMTPCARIPPQFRPLVFSTLTVTVTTHRIAWVFLVYFPLCSVRVLIVRSIWLVLPFVYVVGVSANLTVKQPRPMQVPRNSKALAFGHEVTLRGTLAIMDCY